MRRLKRAIQKNFPGTPTGDVPAQLRKLQDDATTATKLLQAKLATLDEKTTPSVAAEALLSDLLADAKKQNDETVTKVKGLGLPDAPGQPPLAQRLDDLNKLDLSDKANRASAATQALQLVQDYPKLSNDIATMMRAKLWESTKDANPKVSPTELAQKYNENLAALHQELSSQPGPLLPEQSQLVGTVSPDRKSTDPSMEKSYADMLIELDKAAKAMSIQPVVDRLNAEAEKLMLAREAIAGDIPAMKAKAVAEPTQKEHYEDRVKKMEAAVKDLETKITDLLDKKVALQQEEPNPEKNKNLALAIGAANKAVTDIERVRPAINHTRGDDPKYIDHYKEIDTSALETLCGNDAYKKGGKEEKTGDILRGLQTEIGLLKEATEALKAVAAKMVTPEAQAAYEKEYKACLSNIDQHCLKIAQAINDPASRDLIDAAFTSSDTAHSALTQMTKDLAELDKMNVRLGGGFTADVHRDLIAPIDHSLQVSKDNAKKMGDYFTFNHENFFDHKHHDEVIKGKDGYAISLNREEIKQLIAQWNKEHPDQKPPITWDEKKGVIECGSARVKKEFIGRMIKCYDDRCEKEAKAVKEREAPKTGEVAEKSPSSPVVPEKADGKPDDAKKAGADASHQPPQASMS